MGRVRGDHDCGFLRRMWRRGIGIACAAAAVMSLTSCVPQGKAVGDTQESEPEIAHEASNGRISSSASSAPWTPAWTLMC
mgnify:FL=1